VPSFFHCGVKEIADPRGRAIYFTGAGEKAQPIRPLSSFAVELRSNVAANDINGQGRSPHIFSL